MYPNPNIAYSPDSVTYDTERYTALLDDNTVCLWVCPYCGCSHSRNQTTRVLNGYDMHADCLRQFTKWHLAQYREYYGEPHEDRQHYKEDFNISLADELFERMERWNKKAEERRRHGENIEYYYSK